MVEEYRLPVGGPGRVVTCIGTQARSVGAVYTDVQWAGREGYGAVIFSTSNASLTNSNVHNSAGFGIDVNSHAQPVIGSASDPTLFNSIFNNAFGLRNVSTTAVVDARNNYWGHPSGPYHPIDNPDGQGNRVSDGVLFDPWIVNP